MFSRKLLLLLRRKFSASKVKANMEHDDCFKEFKRQQQLYQKNDGLPVFLKRGKSDKILYFATLGLSVVGLIYSLGFIGQWAFFSPTKITEQTNDEK